ncbi:MAG TPA: M28 family peptidase [Flavobacterium sp.]|jgi:aminopeptidase YwaD
MMPRTAKLFFILCLIFTAVHAGAQSYVPVYGAVVAQVSETNVLTNLEEFESFGVKYRGTAAQENTLQWLKNKYLSFGYTANQIVEDSFSYSGSTCKNLVVTKIGTLYPNTYVIVDGHYDTVNGPGTNDNGSGVSVILEIARLLRNVPTQYSIKFINFSGEEDGLIGSQHYVDAVVNATTPKMDIRLVLNLDQVGGVAGELNNTITCERDQSNSPSSNNAASNTMTMQLMNCVELYSSLNTNLSFAYASDYIPFENNGEVITGLYEFNESPFPHTASDLLVNMDPEFVYKVAQATTGAVLHFAVACTTCNLGTSSVEVKEDIKIYPNPAHDQFFIDMDNEGECLKYSLSDVLGKKIKAETIIAAGSPISLDLAGIPSGVYLLTLETSDARIIRKVIID